MQLNKEQWTRWLVIGAAAVTLVACQPPAPTSESPIQGAAVAGDGSTLLGAWHGEVNGYEAYVHVVDGGSEGLQTVVIAREDGDTGGWGEMRAIPASLDGSDYLSVEVLQDKGHGVNDPLERGYHLIRYRAGPGSKYVTLYAMDEEMVDAAIKRGQIAGNVHNLRLSASSPELIHFLESQKGQDLFSVQIGYLERVDDDEVPMPGSRIR